MAIDREQFPGVPRPPAPGVAALAPGTYDGETVFVTGGGTGLGKAIASEFARLGASIVIASRKPEHLEAGANVNAPGYGFSPLHDAESVEMARLPEPSGRNAHEKSAH